MCYWPSYGNWLQKLEQRMLQDLLWRYVSVSYFICNFYFLFLIFFSFQCIPFNRLYTGQCTVCCRTRERIAQTDSGIQSGRLPTVQKKVHSLPYQYAHENKIKGFSKKEESRKSRKDFFKETQK